MPAIFVKILPPRRWYLGTADRKIAITREINFFEPNPLQGTHNITNGVFMQVCSQIHFFYFFAKNPDGWYGFFGEKFQIFKLAQKLQENSVRGTDLTLLTETPLNKLFSKLCSQFWYFSSHFALLILGKLFQSLLKTKFSL